MLLIGAHEFVRDAARAFDSLEQSITSMAGADLMAIAVHTDDPSRLAARSIRSGR
jgi:hypothetical protein